MGVDTKIEWTHHTFNIVWGCTKVSEECAHCYAESLARRYGVGWGPNAPRKTMGASYWDQPRKWNRAAAKAGERRRVFCSSMADVFEDHPTVEAERKRLWNVIQDTPWLDWLLLTKRPERMADVLGEMDAALPSGFPENFPNVWGGTTVGHPRSLPRLDALRKAPTAVRFVSAEPLLAPLDFTPWLGFHHEDELDGVVNPDQSLPREQGVPFHDPWVRGMDWVIVGGESGYGARPMNPLWARSIRDQCVAAGVPFFFKQWGEWVPGNLTASVHAFLREDGSFVPGDEFFKPQDRPFEVMSCVGKKASGRLLDGRTWDQFPEVAR